MLLGRRPSRGPVVASLVAAVLVGTTLVPAASDPALPVLTPSPAQADEDPQVLAISLDGLNPDAITQLGHADVPNLWRLLDEGAGTLEARSQVEKTVTLPNHTSMVTGRRIDRRHGGHGVTWNDDRRKPATVQKAARHRVGSVFSRVDHAGLSAALYSTKTKFTLFNRSWNAGVDRMGIRKEDDAAVTSAALADLRAHDRAFTFLHLGAADHAGHRFGWMSEPYLDAVRKLDGLVGDVLAASDTEDALADLTIVLTADHGGVPGATSHSAANRRANFRIPFVVWGPGIDHADLYDINPGYRDPGKSRPRLTGKQPVRNGDVANLSLRLLGLDPVPGSQFGVKHRLRVTG